MIKEVTFDNKLEHLVDQQGAKYEGRRFFTRSFIGFGMNYEAADVALKARVLDYVERKGADAYEILHITHRPESTQCSAAADAIFYKNK